MKIKFVFYSFKRQPLKMFRHTQTICRQKSKNCLSVFDHFVGFALKEFWLKPFNTIKYGLFQIISLENVLDRPSTGR